MSNRIFITLNISHGSILQFSFCKIQYKSLLLPFTCFFIKTRQLRHVKHFPGGSLQLIKPALFVRAAHDMLQYSYFIRHFGSFPGWKHRFQGS